MKMKSILLIALALTLPPTTARVHAATYYELTTLAVPFGSPGTTTATGVNNLGEVVGNYAGPDGDYNGPYPHAFQWTGGTYIQITNATSVWGLNDAGLAVGLQPGGDGTGLVHDIHTHAQSGFHVPGKYYTKIGGINNAGKVIGNWYDGLGAGAFIGDYNNPALAQVWNHPYVNHRNEGSTAHGIDNLGRVCGFVDAPYDITPDLPYYIGGFITTDVASPGAFTNFKFGAAETHVTASNTNGTMVGWYHSGWGWTTGFVKPNGGVAQPYMVELPRVVSTDIWDINDRGWLVGSYVQLNEYNQPFRHGFLAVPTTPQPIPLEMQQIPDQLVFTWYSKAFTLQCSPDLNGTYTNIPGATSPWTNSISGERLFFRLLAE
jgi:probable HAF family extracellular repeat protein